MNELRANIEDMLPENYSEEEVFKILEGLGSPLKLASEYNPQKRYLIGPNYYDNYLSILKMVVGICVAVAVSITILEALLSPTDTTLIKYIIDLTTGIITGALAGALQGAFWVTLVFVILERSGVDAGQFPFYNDKWSPNSLPELPLDDHMKISRGETIFSIISTIAITALLYLQPQLIAIYIFDDKLMNSISLFNLDRLKGYMLFIFVSAVLQLGLFIWKYITERWNMPLIIGNAIYNVLISILVITMLRDSSLFNSEFITTLAEITKGSVSTIAIWFDRGKWIFAIIFILITTWDSISTLYKSKFHK
jgi:hypothetical protein